MTFLKTLCVLIFFNVWLAASYGTVVDISSSRASNPTVVNCTDSFVDGAVYSWSFNGVDVNNSAYSISIELSTAVGEYNCTVNEQVFSYIAVNFSNPSIEHHGKSITLYKGNTNKELVCHSYSSPHPTFAWFRQKEGSDDVQSLDNLVGAYTVETDGMISKLKVDTVTEAMRAYYTCHASNIAVPSGYNSTVFVRVHDNLQALWPFLGIVCEALLLAIIMIIYEKRQKSIEAKKNATDDAVRYKEVQNTEE